MAKLSTVEKIKEAREKVKAAKAKRGRQKGFKHSEATKEKIGEGKLKAGAERKLKTYTYPLEDILEHAESELEICCDIVKHEIADQSKFGVQANSETGSFILDYTAYGEKEAFKRVKQMLSWEKTKTVTISLKDRPDLSKIDKKLTSIVKVEERYMLGIDYFSKEEVEKRKGS